MEKNLFCCMPQTIKTEQFRQGQIVSRVDLPLLLKQKWRKREDKVERGVRLNAVRK